MGGMDTSQNVEKTRVWITAHIQAATDQSHPRQDLRRYERRSERSSYNQILSQFCMIVRLDRPLSNVIGEARNYYDRGAYPDLDGKCKGMPFGHIVSEHNNIGADQSAERHRDDKEQEPRNYFRFVWDRLVGMFFAAWILRTTRATRSEER